MKLISWQFLLVRGRSWRSGCYWKAPPETKAVLRVTGEGNVYADKSFYGKEFVSGHADLAETVKVTELVESGDALCLDLTKSGYYQKGQKPYSTLAVGVVSTESGMTLGEATSRNKVTIALMGTVPVKAATENGPIQPGDLLTTSSKPGYAMVCKDRTKCINAKIGKALESLIVGKGR